MRHTFEPGERIIVQGEPATAFYVLMRGKIELSFRTPEEGSVQNEESGSGTDGHPPPHIVGHRGYPVGWASIVEPRRYRATAVARERTEMLVLKIDLFEEYAEQRPDFGLKLMLRVLWLIGNHLRMTRTRFVAARYGNTAQTVRALLDQNAATLSVDSPLHKIPHYLESRLTRDDAHRTLEMLEAEGDAAERELAAQIADLLDEVWREVEIFRQLQTIYELVASAPPTMSPEELRRRSCEAFAELFEGTDYIIRGEENLPEKPGHIFVMNHLSNHPDNVLPNDFILTLDTHFVSSMILLKKYDEAPVRVVRKSDPGEYVHQKFYDQLGYIYVYSGYVDPTNEEPISSKQRRRMFLDAVGEHLRSGRNIIICPERTSTETENSPVPFKTGAFHLAANVRLEPLLVPIAVANFDKKLTRTRTAAVVHKPIRLSDHLGDDFDNHSLREFVNNHIYNCFQDYVREATRLATGVPGGTISTLVSRTVLTGGSFAGGLAVMAEAVMQVADFLVVAVPSFGWTDGRRLLVEEGSGREVNRYLEAYPEQEEDVMRVLSYFDPMNFAPHVRCPSLVGVGLEDNVVPAPTVYAIANHLGGPHEVVRLPVSHTDRPEEKLWQRFEAHWLGLAVEGVPPDFGEGLYGVRSLP